MSQKEDRRVQRTRNMLLEAFMDLMFMKGYEEITVQNIIDRANVGRSTFYFHFGDKEQLLLASIAQLREFLMLQGQQRATSGEANAPRFGFSLAMLQHIQTAKRMSKATIGNKDGVFVLSHVRRMLVELTRDEIAAFLPDSAATAVPREILIDFVLNTFLNLVTWWLENDTPCAAAEVDRLFHQLVLSGLDGFRPVASL